VPPHFSSYPLMEDDTRAARDESGEGRTVVGLSSADMEALRRAVNTGDPKCVEKVVRGTRGRFGATDLRESLAHFLAFRPHVPEAQKVEVVRALRPLVTPEWLNTPAEPTWPLVDHAIRLSLPLVAGALLDMGATVEFKLPEGAHEWVHALYMGFEERVFLRQLSLRLGVDTGSKDTVHRNFALMMQLSGTRGLWTEHCTHTAVLARCLISFNAHLELIQLLDMDKDKDGEEEGKEGSRCPEPVLNSLMLWAFDCNAYDIARALLDVPRFGDLPTEAVLRKVCVLEASKVKHEQRLGSDIRLQLQNLCALSAA